MTLSRSSVTLRALRSPYWDMSTGNAALFILSFRAQGLGGDSHGLLVVIESVLAKISKNSANAGCRSVSCGARLCCLHGRMIDADR